MVSVMTTAEVELRNGERRALLHGDTARSALTTLPMKLKAIYAVSATAEGEIVTPMPGDDEVLAKMREGELKGERGWLAAVDWVHGEVLAVCSYK